jgi:hypothetical protein
LAIDPGLARMNALETAWMVGIQFYLSEQPRIIKGNMFCADSPWKLSFDTQAQYWNADFADTFGDGRARDCLSAVIADWTSAGIVYGKVAKDCSAREIARECWEQIKTHVNKAGRPPKLDDDMLVGWALDEGLVRRDGRLVNEDPLILATAGTEQYRPNGVTSIPNLVLAGDYLDGAWQVGTMESASYHGRLAANAILAGTGSLEIPVNAVGPYRPPEWEPLKLLDAGRYAREEPNLFDVGGPLPLAVADLLKATAAEQSVRMGSAAEAAVQPLLAS